MGKICFILTALLIFEVQVVYVSQPLNIDVKANLLMEVIVN